jgi:predicted anti-sigma-YlaC factor YlaD
MHLDDEQIQRLLDQHLDSSATEAARAHLGSCSECRTRLDQAEQEDTWLSQRLQLLDHPTPAVSATGVAGRARRRSPTWRRIAAGILLAVTTAGVAYAVPGSPVPRWFHRIASLITSNHPRQPGAMIGNRPESRAGIAVAPGRRFIIEVAPGQALDSAVVMLTDATELVVRAQGGTTSFASDVGRLAVRHSGAPGVLEIEVPRTAPWVELTVGRRRVWLKSGAKVESPASADEGARYHVSLR